MSKAYHIHGELLAAQAATLFKYVNDQKHHRSIFEKFSPVKYPEGEEIRYVHEPKSIPTNKSYSDIIVTLGGYQFVFRQWYNFGVMLDNEVRVYMSELGTVGSLTKLLNHPCVSEEKRLELIIKAEFALSLITENLASNLTGLEGTHGQNT